MKTRVFAVLLIAPGLLLGPCYAQNAGANSKSAARPRNNKFTIAYATSTRTWNVGNKVQTGEEISQAIGDALAKQLSGKGFLRVPVLDAQCCTLQVELTEVTSSKSGVAVAARVVLMDIDKQNLYSHVYRADGTSGGTISSAAAALAKSVAADPDFIRGLTGS